MAQMVTPPRAPRDEGIDVEALIEEAAVPRSRPDPRDGREAEPA